MKCITLILFLSVAISVHSQNNSSDPDCSRNLKVNQSFCPVCDGSNDVFAAEVSDLEYDSLSMIIYDRWGEKIFNETSLSPLWDGKQNDTPMPQGVYVWIINIYRDGNKLLSCSGSVSLIR